jgi:hypothetical protein
MMTTGNPMRRIARVGLFGFAITLFASGTAVSQDVDVPFTRTGDDAKTHAVAQYSHLFESDTDKGGKVERDNASLTVGHRFGIAEDVGLTIQAGYHLSVYDFSGSSLSQGTGAFQWDDVHDFRTVGLVDWKIDEHWTLLGGVAFFGQGEGGARIKDATTIGAAVGFDYLVSDSLTLGALIGAATGIEDSANLFIIPRVDWRFAEHWRWRVDSLASFGGRGIGTELSFIPIEEVEISLGVTRQRKRFRLAKRNGTAINRGVGEEISVPVYVRVGFRPAPRVLLDAMFGVNASGSLRVETRTGARVEADNFDPAAIIGFGGVISF